MLYSNKSSIQFRARWRCFIIYRGLFHPLLESGEPQGLHNKSLGPLGNFWNPSLSFAEVKGPQKNILEFGRAHIQAHKVGYSSTSPAINASWLSNFSYEVEKVAVLWDFPLTLWDNLSYNISVLPLDYPAVEDMQARCLTTDSESCFLSPNWKLRPKTPSYNFKRSKNSYRVFLWWIFDNYKKWLNIWLFDTLDLPRFLLPSFYFY